MAIQNVEINVKTNTGYDQLYPSNNASYCFFSTAGTYLTSTNVANALDELAIKVNNAQTSADSRAASLSVSNATLTLSNESGATLSAVTVNNVANATNATTADAATKSTQDESGNNIKHTYAATLIGSNAWVGLYNKNNGNIGGHTVNNVANAGNADIASKVTINRLGAAPTITDEYARFYTGAVGGNGAIMPIGAKHGGSFLPYQFALEETDFIHAYPIGHSYVAEYLFYLRF